MASVSFVIIPILTLTSPLVGGSSGNDLLIFLRIGLFNVYQLVYSAKKDEYKGSKLLLGREIYMVVDAMIEHSILCLLVIKERQLDLAEKL